MAAPSDLPPSLRKRARLAAAGLLPYEPAAVYSGALVGMLLLVAACGDGWFEAWRNLLRDGVEARGDLTALGRAASNLGLRAVGGLLAASLLCGWGVGWMQRRLSPPASAEVAPDLLRRAGPTQAPRWFALLLAVCATTSLAVMTLVASGLWYRLPLSRLEAAKEVAGPALLLFATLDLVVAALLTSWRNQRFDRAQAMSRAEQNEETKQDATPAPVARETRLRRELAD